jgi:hypothetical protein
MDNTNPMNKLNPKLEELIASVRKTVLVTNMSLATALETSFMATYENKNGICSMAMRKDNTAIMLANGTGGDVVYKCDFIISGEGIGERRAVFQCEDAESAEEIYELLNDRMYAWSNGEINEVGVD